MMNEKSKSILSGRIRSLFSLGALPVILAVADQTTATSRAEETATIAILLQTATPVYPSTMLRSGMSGKVTLRFLVDSHGSVRNTSVVDATDWNFSQSAIAAVSKWKFKPATRDGIPVESWVAVPILFNITDER